MKVKLVIEKEFDVKYLKAEVGARYWEDSSVDGVEDSEGDLIPCREGEYWAPVIDIETGIIINWDQGKTAKIHYKSCDDNVFTLLDSKQEPIKSIEGYVIDMMCPVGEGFGDYVIMHIDANGKIDKFEAKFDEFLVSDH